MGPATFADEIGVARAVISHILSERNKASLEVVQKILARFSEISPEWLLLGQGEMLKRLDENRATEATSSIETLETQKSSEELHSAQRNEKVQLPNSQIKGVKQQLASEERKVIKVILLYSDGKFESFDQPN